MEDQDPADQNEAFNIRAANSPSEIAAIKLLFRDYEQSLRIDLCFQGFEQELASLPGKYGPPGGELLLALDREGNPIGCVALRPIDQQVCEMKRLYVDPSARGLGLGSALVESILEAGRRIGYREMRLDTLPTMEQAVALYRRFGFEPIEPYYETPIEGTLFLKRSLL